MKKNLVIVESPAKAKTIEKMLGATFKVRASFGHVRDLPKSKLGVDLENNFEPQYLIPAKAKKVVKELKEDAKDMEAIYLATDLDREGEAISWHLLQALGLEDHKAQNTNHKQSAKSKSQTKKNSGTQVHRIVFNQITEKAVKDAVANPRELDMNLVDAQQARRVLDRLVGYKLSPFLWKKVKKGLSAGRVQSVAVRLIVERERAIEAFKPDEFWEIVAKLQSRDNAESGPDATVGAGADERRMFEAKLLKKGEEDLKVTSKEQADKILAELDGASYKVGEVRRKEKNRNPSPPFTTSTLQQEAARKLGFSAKKTMMMAQRLYEGMDLGSLGHKGLITYMRTDSLNLAPEAIDAMRGVIKKDFGDKYVPEKPNFYKNKSKGAQEAHEAIRPTHPELSPDEMEKFLEKDEHRLYALVWKRALASQMVPAIMDSTSVDVLAEGRRLDAEESRPYLFRATGSVIKFDGFIRVYIEDIDEDDKIEDEDREGYLPPLEQDDDLDLQELTPTQKFTQPPPRFTEASLVKELEKNEIGRPSTYAPTLSTIQDRGYVVLEEKKFKPQEIGLIVNDVLVEHFPQVVDVQFTSHVEEEFDDIAEGKMEWHEMIGEFWVPFEKNLKEKEVEVKKEDIIGDETTDIPCPKCGKMLAIKFGRYGKFLACTGFPECKHTQPLNETKDEEAQVEAANRGNCEKCGSEFVIKEGRFGKFIACSNYPECKNIKNLDNKIDMKCPDCGKGDVVIKRTKRGKRFWGCNRYPDCKWASWTNPQTNADGTQTSAENDADKRGKNETQEKGAGESGKEENT